jgi:hypothetical protein
MTNVTARPTGRLHWRLPGSPTEHVLDVMPSLLPRVRLVVDGRIVATVGKPSRSRPWVEREIEVDGRDFTVVLSLDFPDFAADVFMNGASLMDGRTLADARRAAPKAVTGFEAWTYPPVSDVARIRLAPAWFVAMVLVALATLTAAGLVRPAEPLRTPLVALLTSVYVIVFVRTWAILIARTHRWLGGRSDLPDLTRMVLFVGVIAAIPFVLSVAAIGLLVLTSLLTRFVAG